MAYVPPWKRQGAAPMQTVWMLSEIDAALPGQSGHTFTLSDITPDSDKAPHLVRIMKHAQEAYTATGKALPPGQYDLWTRHHFELLGESIGMRLPLFLSHPSTVRASVRQPNSKAYEYCGYHTIDQVDVHAGGSEAVQTFVRGRAETTKQRHSAAEWNAKFADAWACVKVKKCDAEVQAALGDPMHRWVAAGRPARVRPPKQEATAEEATSEVEPTPAEGEA